MTLQQQLRLLAAITLISLSAVVFFSATQLLTLQSTFENYQTRQQLILGLAEIKSTALGISRLDPVLPDTEQLVRKGNQHILEMFEMLSRATEGNSTLTEQLPALKKNWDEYQKGFGQAIKIAETSPQDALSMPDMLYQSKIEPMIRTIDQITDANRADKETAEQSILASIQSILWIIAPPLVFAGLIILVFQTIFNRRLKSRVGDVILAMNHLIDGNLTHRLPASYADEIGTMASTINAFIARFEAILGEVNTSAGQTLRTTDRVTQMAQTVSENASVQSRKVSDVSLSIGGMHQATTEIAAKANQAATTALRTRNQVREGAKLGIETNQALSRLDTTMCTSAQTMDGLNLALLQIDSISNIIKRIAEQTKLLALNAAIEAARAGEYGRGFAVVADEVRNLSDRTTHSAIDISNLLEAVRASAIEAVGAMRTARGEVQSTASHGEKIGHVLTEIETSMQQVAEMMQQIAQATEAQSRTSDEIMQHIQAVSNATQATSGDIQMTRDEMTQLAQSSEVLHRTISQFRFTIPPRNQGDEIWV